MWVVTIINWIWHEIGEKKKKEVKILQKFNMHISFR